MSSELAAGGVIQPAGVLAGLGTDGPEAVIPLNPPTQSAEATSER